MQAMQLVEIVRDWYQTTLPIPLHAPVFAGNEKSYVMDTLESSFVSSVGAYVTRFEQQIAKYCGASDAVATVNGSAALQVALYVAGVQAGDLVVTQSLTFVATCNAIHWLGADPVFTDVEKSSLGLSPDALQAYLDSCCKLNVDGFCIETASGRRVKAVVPMHTFGHPVRLNALLEICQRWNLELIEDAAESLGSWYSGKHTGTIGRFGALSFNGNKIITTGGGGMVLCRDKEDGLRVRHLTTTAKKPHAFLFDHDDFGFNYRMPNLNAALGVAQMERLSAFLDEKRCLANYYQAAFENSSICFFSEPEHAKSNYWLNAIICPDSDSASQILEATNCHKVNTRPVWKPMHLLPMFAKGLRLPLPVTEELAGRIVNLPSSVRINK